MMGLPIGAWSGWDEPSGIRRRSELHPIAAHTDDDIDQLYAELVKVDARGDFGHARDALVARINYAEGQRALEMAAYFRQRGALDGVRVADLLARVDDVLNAE